MSKRNSQVQTRRAVAFARHASQTRVDAQVESIRQHALATGVKLVDVVEQVGGPSGIHHSTLRSIISRKIESGDFDLILIEDFSRLTRGGAARGIALQWQLFQAGIDVISIDSSKIEYRKLK